MCRIPFMITASRSGIGTIRNEGGGLSERLPAQRGELFRSGNMRRFHERKVVLKQGSEKCCQHSFGVLQFPQNGKVIVSGKREGSSGKRVRRPETGKIPRLTLKFRQLSGAADGDQRRAGKRTILRTQMRDILLA